MRIGALVGVLLASASLTSAFSFAPSSSVCRLLPSHCRAAPVVALFNRGKKEPKKEEPEKPSGGGGLFGDFKKKKAEPAAKPAKAAAKSGGGFKMPSFGSPPPSPPPPPPPPAKKAGGFSFPSFGGKSEEAPPAAPAKAPPAGGFSMPSFGGGAAAPSPPKAAPPPPPPAAGGGGGFSLGGLTGGLKLPDLPGQAAPPEPEPEFEMPEPEPEPPSGPAINLPDGIDGTLIGAGVAGATAGGVLTDIALAGSGIGFTGELAADAAAVGAVVLGGATVYAAAKDPEQAGKAARFVGGAVSNTTSAYAELAAVNAELAVLEQQQKIQAVVDEKVDQLERLPGEIAAVPTKAVNAANQKLTTSLIDIKANAQAELDAARREIEQGR